MPNNALTLKLVQGYYSAFRVKAGNITSIPRNIETVYNIALHTDWRGMFSEPPYRPCHHTPTASNQPATTVSLLHQCAISSRVTHLGSLWHFLWSPTFCQRLFCRFAQVYVMFSPDAVSKEWISGQIFRIKFGFRVILDLH